MRETLTLIIRKNICYRITPAYAGNTIPACRRFPFGQDHPRVCGKHRTKSLSYSPAAGSPPRMRETQLQTAEKAPMTGITPAYAGNTKNKQHGHNLLQDHPRVCGKHNCRLPRFRHVVGSPPRMRETLFNFPVSFSLPGITPAYAGNTTTVLFSHLPRRDHPRVCGKHHSFAEQGLKYAGSPPRMRETQ